MSEVETGQSGGVYFQSELERRTLLPGRSATGTVTLTVLSDVEIRGCVAALVATEQWKYTDTDRDSEGHTRTRTRTATHEPQRLPVMLLGPTTLSASAPRVLPVAFPVPPLGPATICQAASRKCVWSSRSRHVPRSATAWKRRSYCGGRYSLHRAAVSPPCPSPRARANLAANHRAPSGPLRRGLRCRSRPFHGF